MPVGCPSRNLERKSLVGAEANPLVIFLHIYCTSFEIVRPFYVVIIFYGNEEEKDMKTGCNWFNEFFLYHYKSVL